MSPRAPNLYDCDQVVLLVRNLTIAFASTIFIASLLSGQGRTPPPPNPPPPPRPPQQVSFDEQHIKLESTAPRTVIKTERDNCFLAPLTGIQLPTVGVTNLQISSKAKKDYSSGCNAFRDGKFDSAEENFRKAVNDEPKYVTAWVTLGQLLAARLKLDDAKAACSTAQSADSLFVPAHLCLADIAARSGQWDDALKLSSRALEIDPSNNPAAYDYNAAAQLNLHHVQDAEKSALKAIEIDRNHSDPRVHFLLAQIYEAEGDHDKEAVQLREYLKYASGADAAMVKQYLSKLEKK